MTACRQTRVSTETSLAALEGEVEAMGAGALDLLDVPMLGKNTADNRSIIGFMRDTLTGTLRATGMVANDAVEVVRDVLTGAVDATEEAGTETLGAVGTLGNGVATTARDILVGGVGGVKEVLGNTVPARRAPEETGRTREPAAPH